MARPLREQFAIATFLLLAPVIIVMTVAGSLAYFSQVAQVSENATDIAGYIAGFVDAAGPSTEDDLKRSVDQYVKGCLLYTSPSPRDS